MKTADWYAVTTANCLLVGESSTLQWSDEIIEHAMFLDYYFDHAPYDLGERSRWSEAKLIFETIIDISAGKCQPQNLHATLISNTPLLRPPKGKHILIPENEAKQGFNHIKSLLEKFPTIKTVFVMGLQANHYLQKFGLYSCGDFTEKFVYGSGARRVGLESYKPYYQPVNAKVFAEVAFKRFPATSFEGVDIIPILPTKSYPLSGKDLLNYNDQIEDLKASF